MVKAAHRVKLSKLNQTGSTWTRVFKRRKLFSFSLLSVVFLHTANRPDENELIQFLNYHRRARDVCTQASVCKSVHKITVFIPEIIYGARNGLLMALFIRGGGVLHIMTYMGRLRTKGVPFLGYRYTKE